HPVVGCSMSGRPCLGCHRRRTITTSVPFPERCYPAAIVQYIPQQHQMGCEIAAVAMILDMSLEQGMRYLGMISTHEPLINHVVAVDERGLVFDPDPANG